MLWSRAGVFESLWRAGLAEYDDCEGIAWRWQSIDGAMFKAPLAQEAVGRNPTDRGKRAASVTLLVDGRGVPLSLVMAGANAHDVTQLEAVLASCMIKRPAFGQRRSKHLCANAGYRGKNAIKISQTASRAWFKSMSRSLMCSMPMERRIIPSVTPALASSSGLSWRCVVLAGCVARDRVSPMFTRR